MLKNRLGQFLKLISLSAVAACSSTESLHSNNLKTKKATERVLAWSNTFGQTVPCHCHLEPFGGLERRYNLYRHLKLRTQKLHSLNSGNFLFPYKPSPVQDQLFLDAEKQAWAQSHFNVEAINVGYLDLVNGLKYLKGFEEKYKLPLISTNLYSKTEKPLFKTHKDLKLFGRKFRVLGLTDLGQHEKGYKVLDPIKAGKTAIKDSPFPVLILSDLGHASITKLQKSFPNKEIIFVGQRYGSRDYVMRNSTKHTIIEGSQKGQQVVLLSSYNLHPSKITFLDLKTKSPNTEGFPTPNEERISFEAITLDQNWDRSNIMSAGQKWKN
ncbi:hypothetical protein GW915_12740 [bacterium]|nr:hypothetical protein [bacterium]